MPHSYSPEKFNIETDSKNLEEKAFDNLKLILKKIPDVSIPKQKTLIKNIFDVLPGGSKIGFENYSPGRIPYVSSGSENNSVIGFVRPKNNKEITKAPAITVTAFCNANIQFLDFIGRGNGGSAIKTLIPKQKMSSGELLWYSSQINSQSWRFNYGIMVSLERLEKITVTIPPNQFLKNIF